MQIVSTWPRTGVTSWALPGMYDSLENLASTLPAPWPVLTAKSCPCPSPQWAPPVAWKGLGFPPLNTGCFWALLFTCKTCEFVAFLMWFVVVWGFVFLSWYQQLGGREEQKGGLNSVIYCLFHLNYLWIMYWTDGKNVEYVHYELYSPVCCLEY